MGSACAGAAGPPIGVVVNQPLRIVVVDDQPVVRAGLQTMIDTEPDLTVVGVADNGSTAIEVCAALTPDVVLMDLRMPHVGGIEATRRILAAHDATAVLIITTFDDEESLFESIRAGASGFILKDAGLDLIAAALRSAARGDALIDPGMTRLLLDRHARPAQTRREPGTHTAEILRTLSAREKEILSAVARGLTNRQIARELIISDATVKTHTSNLLAKLGARSRAAAAAFAYESGHTTPHWLLPDDQIPIPHGKVK